MTLIKTSISTTVWKREKMAAAAQDVVQMLEHIEQPPPAPCSTTTAAAASTTPEQWVQGYAAVNIVKARSKVSLLPVSVSGSSKDAIAHFEFWCTKTEGCRFSHVELGRVLSHELSCTPQTVVARQQVLDAGAAIDEGRPPADALFCEVEGCPFWTIGGTTSLQRHTKGQHSFNPRSCDDPECDRTIVYDSESAWRKHRRLCGARRDGYPAPCTHPTCLQAAKGKRYKTRRSLTEHLRDVHGVTAPAEIVKYLPTPPPRFVQQQGCLMQPYCSDLAGDTFDTASALTTHMVDYHGLDETTAKARVAAEARWESRTPPEPGAPVGVRKTYRAPQQKAPRREA